MFTRGPMYSPRHRPARGSVLTSVLVTFSIACVFATAAYFAMPASLYATRDQPQAIEASNERHQETLDLLASMIASCKEIIAIKPRGASPYAELVLRVSGEADEHVLADEVVLISHSRVLQTIVLFEHAPSDTGHRIAFARSSVERPGFADQWRANPEVSPRILATGISDMQLERPSVELLRIVLTWAPDSADGKDVAAALIAMADPSAGSSLLQE